MQCPNCSNQLTATLYEGVDIHFCSSCKGRLLDEHKLDERELEDIQVAYEMYEENTKKAKKQ